MLSWRFRDKNPHPYTPRQKLTLAEVHEQDKEIPIRSQRLKGPRKTMDKVLDSRVTTGLRTHLPDPQTQAILQYLIKHVTTSHPALVQSPSPSPAPRLHGPPTVRPGTRPHKVTKPEINFFIQLSWIYCSGGGEAIQVALVEGS